MKDHDALVELDRLRVALNRFMKPEVLGKFADLVEQIALDNCAVEKYNGFCRISELGPDCEYAKMAKEEFLKENKDSTVRLITWLYENWAKEEAC